MRFLTPEQVVRLADAIDPAREPLRFVVGDERSRLSLVDVEAIRDHLRGIVGPAFRFRAALETGAQLLAGRLEKEDRLDAAAPLGKKVIERVGLRGGPRETVEDDPLIGGSRRQTVADHVDRQIVGYVCARVEDALHTTADVGLSADVIAKEISSRKMEPTVRPRECLRLRALPHSGWAHEDEIATHG